MQYSIALTTLAEQYQLNLRYAEAEEIYKRALAIQEGVLGPDNPEIIGALANLGSAYGWMGRHADVLLIEQRIVARQEKTLGSGEYPRELMKLAGTYESLGRYADAEQIYLRVAAAEQRSGADGEGTLNVLSGFYLKMGRYADAESALKRELKAAMSRAPDNLAQFYQTMGRSSWSSAHMCGFNRPSMPPVFQVDDPSSRTSPLSKSCGCAFSAIVSSISKPEILLFKESISASTTYCV